VSGGVHLDKRQLIVAGVGMGIALLTWAASLTGIAEFIPATPGFLVAITQYGGEVDDWRVGQVVVPVDILFFWILVAALTARSSLRSGIGVLSCVFIFSGLANVFTIPMSNAVILGRLEAAQLAGIYLAGLIRAGDHNFWTIVLALNVLVLSALCFFVRRLLLKKLSVSESWA
jgi:hypothetical protein